jgi:hypothetical protein
VWASPSHLAQSGVATQKAWKLRNNKARFDIVLNLGDDQIEQIKLHKIAKVLWDALKLMYGHLDKATIVVFILFILPKLK